MDSQQSAAVDRKLHQVERFKVDSSSIAALGFEDDVCIVEFPNGHLFAYSMTPEQFEAFAKSESKGRHYAKEIKGKLAGNKLTGGCKECGKQPQVIGETCSQCQSIVRPLETRYADRDK